MNRSNFESLVKSVFLMACSSKTNPIKLLFYVLCFQTVMVAAFNRKTLQNAHDFLMNNKDDITWEINESGFFRTRFPDEILDLSHPLFSEINGTKFSVRTNFWYNKMEGQHMQLRDAAAHDHPNGFMTYIVKNGYTHAVYDIISKNTSATECGAVSDEALE